MEGVVFDGTWISLCHEAAVRYEVPKLQCVMLSALCFMVPRSQCAVEGDGCCGVVQGEPYSVPLPNLIVFLEPQTSLLRLSQGGKI